MDTAHKEAYEFALANKYDYLITMDADLSHDPKEISNFVKYLENNSKSDEIFMKMAKKLSGEEFGSFMMGNAKFSTKLKTIFAMPKIGFLKSFINSTLS